MIRGADAVRISNCTTSRPPVSKALCLRYLARDVAPSSHQGIQLSRYLSLFHNVLLLRSRPGLYRYPARTVSRMAVPTYLPREEVRDLCVLPNAGSRTPSSRGAGRRVEPRGADQERQTKLGTKIRSEDETTVVGRGVSRPRSSARRGSEEIRALHHRESGARGTGQV